MGSLRVTVCTSVLVAAVLTPAAYAADAGGVSVTPATPAPGSDVTLRVTDCAERTAVARSAAFVADARLTVTDGELVGESHVRSTLDAGTYAVKVTCGESERTGTFTVREGERQRSASGAGSEHSYVSGTGTGGQPPATWTGDRPPASVSGTVGQPPAPGAIGQPPAPGAIGQPPATGAIGQPPAPGTIGQPPAPGTVGQPPMPEGGGQPSASGDGGQRPAPGGDEQRSDARRPGAYPSPVAPVQAGGGGAADLVAAEDRGAGPGTAQGVTGLILAGVAAVVVALGGVRRSRGTD
ncbi:hypothetical protein [Streptomyces coeruleorubidus]|uniref:Uncharacterized protein n=1 Tax=Streptomyces coeruleorubidus TaxID=116188 RepID=A0A5J6HZK1_STRC4|nr:hypothetical protein [Streptomyces coeruleorubidus]QEV25609.1 hypothetical protein CP976_16560 [Streptomyces coeruleorubidus]GGT49418.1 hypothetical protein GCM10010256_02070 [Streptomyces coeruleorubidus]